MRHFQIHCATSRGLLSNILSSLAAASVVRFESLIFGIALSSTDEVSCVVVATGEGVRERSELATEQQSGPVDIGSGELGGRSFEAVEHLEEAEDGEGFGGGGDDFLG